MRWSSLVISGYWVWCTLKNRHCYVVWWVAVESTTSIFTMKRLVNQICLNINNELVQAVYTSKTSMLHEVLLSVLNRESRLCFQLWCVDKIFENVVLVQQNGCTEQWQIFTTSINNCQLITIILHYKHFLKQYKKHLYVGKHEIMKSKLSRQSMINRVQVHSERSNVCSVTLYFLWAHFTRVIKNAKK